MVEKTVKVDIVSKFIVRAILWLTLIVIISNLTYCAIAPWVHHG